MRKSSKKKIYEAGNTKGGFLSGVLLLSGSTVIVKIIGLAYKIPMLDRLGTAGMGYFNSAYEIYAILCMVATAGLPVALSMMIATAREQQKSETIRRIDRVFTLLFCVLGVIGCIGLFVFSRGLSFAVGNREAYLCILAIAPSFPFACYSGSVRGYFQGLHRMAPTAISQLLEACGKLLFGVLFADMALRRNLSLPWVAAYAMLGVSVGTLMSAVYLFLAKHSIHKEEKRDLLPERYKKILKDAAQISVPITVGALLISSTKLLDTSMMIRRLQGIGYTAYEANELYGAYTTLAVPVFGLIPSLISPISLVLIPKLTSAMEQRDRKREAELSEESIRLTVLFSMPASLGVVLFSKPILQLLFGGQSSAVEQAFPMLSILGGAILFSGMITTTNAILQAYRHPMLPILSMAVGVLVKGFFAYWLMGIPEIGALGAPISTFLCNVTVTVLNLYFLRKSVPEGESPRGMLELYAKPLLASSASMLTAALVYRTVEGLESATALPLLSAILTGVLLYGLLALWMGMITEEDLSLLPFYKIKMKKKYH